MSYILSTIFLQCTNQTINTDQTIHKNQKTYSKLPFVIISTILYLTVIILILSTGLYSKTAINNTQNNNNTFNTKMIKIAFCFLVIISFLTIRLECCQKSKLSYWEMTLTPLVIFGGIYLTCTFEEERNIYQTYKYISKNIVYLPVILLLLNYLSIYINTVIYPINTLQIIIILIYAIVMSITHHLPTLQNIIVIPMPSNYIGSYIKSYLDITKKLCLHDRSIINLHFCLVTLIVTYSMYSYIAYCLLLIYITICSILTCNLYMMYILVRYNDNEISMINILVYYIISFVVLLYAYIYHYKYKKTDLLPFTSKYIGTLSHKFIDCFIIFQLFLISSCFVVFAILTNEAIILLWITRRGMQLYNPSDQS